jgi:hypothetical protein
MKAGGSHDVYAAWFGNRLSSLPQRVFTLGGNHAVFEKGLPQGNIQEGRNLPHAQVYTAEPCSVDNYFQTVALNGLASERRRLAVGTLVVALEQGQYAAALCAELAPLLFPGRSDVLPREIAQALAELSALRSDRG